MTRQRWEYSRVIKSVAQKLNNRELDDSAMWQEVVEHGDQGWELVNAWSRTETDRHGKVVVTTYVFKRPKD